MMVLYLRTNKIIQIKCKQYVNTLNHSAFALCCTKIKVAHAFLCKIYNPPFSNHLKAWIYSHKVLNNFSILFRYESDPKPAWPGPWWAAPCPCQELPIWPGKCSSPCTALGPELHGHTQALCKTSARNLFSVGFSQYEKFPKSPAPLWVTCQETCIEIISLAEKKPWSTQENPFLG